MVQGIIWYITGMLLHMGARKATAALVRCSVVHPPSAWSQAQLGLQERYFVACKILITQFWISPEPCCGPWQRPRLQLWITPTGQHLADAVKIPGWKRACPCATHSITSTTACCSCREGFYPQVFWPRKIFSDTLTQFQQKLVPKQYLKSSHISTWVEDTQSNIFTGTAETHWSRIMPAFITFPCKTSKENRAAKNCHKPFKSWHVSKNVSASLNDPLCLVWKKSGSFSNSCATISHLYFGTNSRLAFWRFEAFSCDIWNAAPVQTISSCGPSKRRSQTCPSEHC